MVRILSMLIILLILAGCTGKKVQEAKQSSYEKLREGFINPPPGAHPKVYWWWLNGNTDTSRLLTEMREMKKAGISGFDIFEIGVPKEDIMVEAGPAFLSDESLASIKTVIEEAGKLGMKAGLNMASSWNAGGSWIRPEHAAKSIYFSKTEYGGESSGIKLPFPEISEKDSRGRIRLLSLDRDGKPAWYREIAVIAVPSDVEAGRIDTGKIINLSSRFDPFTEELDWKPAEGKWDIYRFVCSNSGEQLMLPSRNSAGPIIDHFDSTATTTHFNHVIGRLRTIIPDLKNSALKSLYLASYEATASVWTPSLPNEFRKINGYDLHKFLPLFDDPALFPDETGKRFMTDFRRTLSELMISNFYKKAREIANMNGLMINSEAGGPGFPLHNVPVEPLKSLGALDLPRGEFWINHNRLNADGIDILRVVKEVSAASHIYQRGIAEEESFSSFQHWQEAPGDIKPVGDRAFCEGMNRYVVHGFSHNPPGTGFPGYVYHAGTHFNDKRVWWPMVRPFNDYLARISLIAQETEFQADVLYYYGDAIPNYTGHKNSRFIAGPGYDYEVINTEILLQLQVDDGELILPGGSRFKLLCLEDEGEINAEVLMKLKELSGQGALILGEKPLRVTRMESTSDTSEYLKMIEKIWTRFDENSNDGNLPESKIISGLSPFQALQINAIGPDFKYFDNDLFLLDYIHYSDSNIHFYFVRNTTDRWISRNCSFRLKSGIPEIWDPVTCDISPVLILNQEPDYISMPLSFPPYGSYFVVFREGEPAKHYDSVFSRDTIPPAVSYSNGRFSILENGIFTLSSESGKSKINSSIKVQNLDGAWELFFGEGQGAPTRVIFPELISWTDHENQAIKYYSGIVKYVKTFQYDINSSYGEGKKVFLDLGELSKIADVSLNGKHLGVAWTKPFRFDVTGILKNGDNTLTVEVANTWSNRLKGDALTGQKHTNTNIRTTNIAGLNKIQVPWAEVPLIRSGLFGPVTLMTIREIEAPIQ